MRAKSHRKIRMFARLLKRGIQKQKLDHPELDVYTDILESLSEHELNILHTLKRFEESYPKIHKEEDSQLEDDNETSRQYWEIFEKVVEDELNIKPVLLRSLLLRLEGKGLHKILQEMIFGDINSRGRLTPLFHDFVEWVEDEAEGLG